MKIIPLNGGYEAVVDIADAELVAGRWTAMKKPDGRIYAIRNVVISPRQYRSELMHRLIMAPAAGQWVDHINHNTLDNQRENLRFCSPQQSARHRGRKRTAKASAFKGVVRLKNGRYIAQISINRWKPVRLGTFDDEIAAAAAYDAAALSFFGQFAKVNLQLPQ